MSVDHQSVCNSFDRICDAIYEIFNATAYLSDDEKAVLNDYLFDHQNFVRLDCGEDVAEIVKGIRSFVSSNPK